MSFKVSEKGECRIIKTGGKYFLEKRYSDKAINTKKLSGDDAVNLIVNKGVSFKWKKCPRGIRAF